MSSALALTLSKASVSASGSTIKLKRLKSGKWSTTCYASKNKSTKMVRLTIYRGCPTSDLVQILDCVKTLWLCTVHCGQSCHISWTFSPSSTRVKSTTKMKRLGGRLKTVKE